MNFLVMTVNFQPTLRDNTIQMSVASCVLPADSTRGPRVQCSSYGSSLGYGSGCTGAPAEWNMHQSSGQSSPLTASSKASSEAGAEHTLKRSLVRTLMPGAGEWVLLSTLFSLRRQKTFLMSIVELYCSSVIRVLKGTEINSVLNIRAKHRLGLRMVI